LRAASDPQSGADLYEANFTDLQTSGTHRVGVPGLGRLLPFEISQAVFDSVYQTLARLCITSTILASRRHLRILALNTMGSIQALMGSFTRYCPNLSSAVARHQSTTNRSGVAGLIPSQQAYHMNIRRTKIRFPQFLLCSLMFKCAAKRCQLFKKKSASDEHLDFFKLCYDLL